MHYPRSSLTDGARKVWLKTFCEDLAHKSDAEIAYACARYRRDPDNKFFPTPGQLLELTTSSFADKPPRLNGRQTERGWQPWGGECQCAMCLEKSRSEGFYHAPKAACERDAAVQGEIDYWMEQQTGYDPKIGNPELDNTIERQRSPAEMQGLIAGTRRKYPGAYVARGVS